MVKERTEVRTNDLKFRRNTRHTCWSELKIKRQNNRNITLIMNNMNMRVRESGAGGEEKKGGGGKGERGYNSSVAKAIITL